MNKAFTKEQIEDAIACGGNVQDVLGQVYMDNLALKCERDGVAISFGKHVRENKALLGEIDRLKGVIAERG